MKDKLAEGLRPLRSFINWILLGVVVGVCGGLVGAAFHACVDWANALRGTHPWLLYLLPAGGVVIALLYKGHSYANTNDVLLATHTQKGLPFLTLPVIFVSTVITQMLGGSAGKEGAAIQMGGTIGYQLGRLLRLDEKDEHVAVMCGLSAVFAAVFGTPVTAAFFALEVISIGAMYYVALIPCMAAVLTAREMAILMGIPPLSYSVAIPEFSWKTLWGVLLLALLCAYVSILFCEGLHKGGRGAKKLIQNDILRPAVGGALLIGLTLLSGGTAYNGAGFNLVESAMAGDAPALAFLLKMLFTAVTIGFGFRGGEIVPTMAIGATLGCTVARLLGADPAFFAAIGLISMFCGMVNCPVASILLGVELFGVQGLIYYAAACTAAFALSGNYGLYSSQKLLYSKMKAEFINITIKE